MLFPVYLGCLIVGMGLVAASFFSDHDTDVDVDVDMDIDVDVDADLDVEAGVDVVDAAHGVDTADALWLPLLSLRFWIFFAAFFGLTGTLLEGLKQGPSEGLRFGVALGVGLFSGYLVARLVNTLRREKVNSTVDPSRDYVGRRGDVLLDVVEGDPGTVRIHAGGVDIDLPAELDPGQETIPRGKKVVVVEYRDGTILVAPFHPED